MRKVDFIIAGAQKGGTTALHKFLGQHPDVFFPERKELHHFNQPAGALEKLGHYRAYHKNFEGAPPEALKGEATPVYMFWPGTAERLHRYNPALKLIVILREPGARAYSHWVMATGRGKEDRSFSEVIRSKEPDNPPDRIRSYMSRGFYAGQLKRLYRLFSRDQVLVLLNDDLRSDPDTVMAHVTEFLGLAPHQFSSLEREVLPVERSNTPPPSMTAEDRKWLNALYDDDIRELQDMLGRDLSHWMQREIDDA